MSFYLAGLMTAPMVAIELSLMSAVYENKKLNLLLMAVSVAAGIMFLTLIRQQTLCIAILSSQRAIDQMRTLLAERGRR